MKEAYEKAINLVSYSKQTPPKYCIPHQWSVHAMLEMTDIDIVLLLDMFYAKIFFF